MVTYEIRTKKFDYGDNTFENALDNIGLKIKCIASGYKIPDVGDSLIYKVERKEKLTVEEEAQIICMDGVRGIEELK